MIVFNQASNIVKLVLYISTKLKFIYGNIYISLLFKKGLPDIVEPVEAKSAGSAKCYEKNLRMILNFTPRKRKSC